MEKDRTYITLEGIYWLRAGLLGCYTIVTCKMVLIFWRSMVLTSSKSSGHNRYICWKWK